jgi:hypothetical protein
MIMLGWNGMLGDSIRKLPVNSAELWLPFCNRIGLNFGEFDRFPLMSHSFYSHESMQTMKKLAQLI